MSRASPRGPVSAGQWERAFPGTSPVHVRAAISTYGDEGRDWLPCSRGTCAGSWHGIATSGGGVTTLPPTHTGAPGRTPGERAERPVTGSSGSLETSRRGWTEAWAPPQPPPCLVRIAGAMPASGPGPASRPRLPPPCQAHGVLPFHVTEAGGHRTGRAETACPTSVPWGPDERHPRVARWPSPGLREEGGLLRQTSLP